jgi:hypothetical protein
MLIGIIATWEILQAAPVALHPWRIFFTIYMIARILENFGFA